MPTCEDPAKPHLGTKQGILADRRSMADLDQVIDLDPSGDLGVADTGAIDAGIGLNFHPVAEHNGPGLGDLVPRAVILFGKPIPIRPNHRSVLQDDAIPQAAALANHGMGMGEAILSQLGLGVNHHVGQQGRAFADDRSRANHHVGSDMHILADRGAGVDHRRGVNSRRIHRGGMEDIDGAGKGKVGVGGAQGGSRDRLKLLGHQNRPRLGGAGKGSVLGVGHEGQLAGTSLFNSLDPGDFLIPVSMAGSAK